MGKYATKGASDIVPPTQIGTGTPDGTKFLKDNGVWSVPPGGGGTPASTVVAETAYGASSAVGVSTDYARADHTHGSPALGTTGSTACAGNDSRLSDARTPTAHAASHKSAGGDAIKLDELAAPTDVTTLNATVSLHGLLPKLGGGTTNFLRADGTWAAPSGGSGLTHDTIMLLPFFRMANLTAVTALATNTSYFYYLGKVSSAISTLDIRCRVSTAAATITWAEVGVFRGAAPAFAGAASLTRVGFTNVAATFNSTGQKTTTVALSGVSANDELWLAVGSQATTPFQLRGGLADDLQTGWFQTFAGRISTMALPSSTTLAGATAVPAWLAAKL